MLCKPTGLDLIHLFMRPTERAPRGATARCRVGRPRRWRRPIQAGYCRPGARCDAVVEAEQPPWRTFSGWTGARRRRPDPIRRTARRARKTAAGRSSPVSALVAHEARKASRTACVTVLVENGNGGRVIGHFLTSFFSFSGPSTPPGLPRLTGGAGRGENPTYRCCLFTVIRRGAAQEVVDRRPNPVSEMCMTAICAGHRPLKRAQPGEQVGRRLGELAASRLRLRVTLARPEHRARMQAGLHRRRGGRASRQSIATRVR